MGLNPINDVIKKVDRTLATVDTVLGQVDGTLSEVSTTLTDVDGTLGHRQFDADQRRQHTD